MAKKSRDRWPELCEVVADDDRLPVRASGRWAEDKLWTWNRYIEITTNAMSGKRGWSDGLVYVDLFAGPGVCEISGTARRIPGSPLIAANAPKPFRRIILCEKDAALADACCRRMAESPASQSFQMFVGDCNDLVDEIRSHIPQRALTLAFLDPTGLHADIETLCRLTKDRRVDILVLFADAYDAVRNAEYHYFSRPDSKLDRQLGPDSDWRTGYEALGSTDGAAVRRFFFEVYQRQLRRFAGYEHFREMVIHGDHGPLYRLVYASKHTLGSKFWDNITQRDRGGQRLMRFD